MKEIETKMKVIHMSMKSPSGYIIVTNLCAEKGNLCQKDFQFSRITGLLNDFLHRHVGQILISKKSVSEIVLIVTELHG
jgi:hypothetical protein